MPDELTTVSDDFNDADSSRVSYKSSIQKREVSVRQSHLLDSSSIMTRIYQSLKGKPSNISLLTFYQTHFISSGRKREKDDLTQLNDNFARYIEAIRYLEVENQMLKMEMDVVQNSVDQCAERLKKIYEIEISEAKTVLCEMFSENDNNSMKNEEQIEAERLLIEEMTRLCQFNQIQIDSIRQKICENDAEILLYRRRLSDLDDEEYHYKREMSHLIKEIKEVQTKIQNEIYLKIIYQTEKMVVEDQIQSNVLKHEIEMNELRSKSVSFRIDPSKIFRHELSQAIKQMRKEYERTIEETKRSLENRYQISVNELIINQKHIEYENVLFDRDLREKNALEETISNFKRESIELKIENDHLKQKMNQLQNEIHRLKEKYLRESNEKLGEIESTRQHLNWLEIDCQSIKSFNVTLSEEINTYRHLLEGRNDVKVHLNRILQDIKASEDKSFFNIISKEDLPMKPIKDLRKAIFIETSDSTSYELKSSNMSVLQAELNICQLIPFDFVVTWNTHASIWNKNSIIQPIGLTNPHCIFQNHFTNEIFNQCQLIVIVSYGQIGHENVVQISSHMKNSLNKILILCVIIKENAMDRSDIDISVIAPFILTSNFLCLLSDGKEFSVILSKGSISSYYPVSDELIDLEDLFNTLQLHENIPISNDSIVLDDDLQQCSILSFDKFINLNDLDRMILLNENQWRTIIQYGKINNRLDEIKYFVTRMKNSTKSSDFIDIIENLDIQYEEAERIIQEKISNLNQMDSEENDTEIIELEKELEQIFTETNQNKFNYMKENFYLTANYWDQVLELIYRQEVSLYSIKDFQF